MAGLDDALKVVSKSRETVSLVFTIQVRRVDLMICA